MMYKYILNKDTKNNELSIGECCEVDVGQLQTMYQEIYQIEKIQKAMNEGSLALINQLRTTNLYPCTYVMEKIATKVVTLIKTDSDPEQPIEIVFHDLDIIPRKEEPPTDLVPEEVNIDTILDQDEEIDETPFEDGAFLDPDELDPGDSLNVSIDETVNPEDDI
ncbi:MAG: hypothetical protein HQK77_14435 [Desulfobacterales bacterium]|nr:hypothetical protein [Desulfobacterales bacterium]